LGDRQVDEFGDAHSGLDREEQHRVVAAPDPSGAVRCSEQRVDLAAVEVGDGGLAVAGGGDLEHAGDAGGVLGVSQCGVAEQRVDRREPRVAGAGAVASVLVEVGEKRGDERRVEVRDVEPAWRFPGPLLGEAQEQTQRVAVGGDRVRADLALGQHALREERFQRGRELGHDRPP
jgi:hypothetical protein